MVLKWRTVKQRDRKSNYRLKDMVDLTKLVEVRRGQRTKGFQMFPFQVRYAFQLSESESGAH